MNAYLRAANKYPQIKEQAKVQLDKRKGQRPLRPDKPNINRPALPGNGRPNRRSLG